MNAVATIKPHVANIVAPDALRSLQGWLVWRYEQEPGETKARKVPYYTNGGKRHGVQGRPEDRAQLTTFDAARAAAARRGFDGVGFALMPEFNVVALDFDHCVADGGVRDDVLRVVSSTYAEYSPSGEGVRAFFRGNQGNRKAHGEPYGFETFSTKGFVTFTGNRLEVTDLLGMENTVADTTDEVRELCARRFGSTPSHDDDPLMSYSPALGLTEQQMRDMLDVLDPDMQHQQWLNVGLALHHETEGEGFHLWDEWSATGSKYPGEETLQKRWDSFGNSNDGRNVTARTLMKMAVENGAYVNLSMVSADDFDALMSEVDTEKTKFRVVPAGEFSQGKPPGWIVKGVLPRAELAVLFGESGSGKSFVTLDLAAAIARGIDWRGHRVKQGRVVYIAAEGGGGFRNRLSAYALHHGIDLSTIPFGIIHASPNFLNPKDASEVSAAIVASGKADLIVVDTFAQVTPGANENAADDVGKALSHCKRIHEATGATVLLIHHSGKDSSRGARGWSGLRAAADAELEVVRSAAGRMLRVSKQKDGDDSGEWGFDLQPVTIGVDEDGDPIDSCVVVEAEAPVAIRIGKKRNVGAWEKLVIEVMGEFGLGQNCGIEQDAVIEEVVRRSPALEGKRDTRKQRANRALKSLCEGDDAPFMLEDDGCISIL